MNKQKILILISIIIITSFIINSWYNFISTEYLPTWRQNLGLIFYLILIILFFINVRKAIIATGIFLLLATFNVLAITTGITTNGIIIASKSIPRIQLLSFGLFILYFILNLNELINIYLDYKESMGK